MKAKRYSACKNIKNNINLIKRINMKGLFLTAALITTILMSCSSTPQSSGDVPEFAGKDWKLIEVYIDGNKTQFNRNSLQNESTRNLFTLKFDGQALSGIGAPNNFSSRYTLGNNQAITILPGITTLMAPLSVPGNLSEYDFYAYLYSAQKWGMVNNNLELHSKTADGKMVILKFGQ
jgi:heat shock protein HslJ